MNNRAKIKALQAKIRTLQAKLVMEQCWTNKYRNLWIQELTAAPRVAVPQQGETDTAGNGNSATNPEVKEECPR